MSRVDFYHSTIWRKQSKLYALSKYCICEKCGRPVYVDGITPYQPKDKRLKYVVHHKIHLNESNYNDYNISLNWDNLQLLCIDCHNQEHSNAITRNDVMFDEQGNLVERKVVKRTAN